MVQDAWNTAVSADPAGTVACVAAWRTDLREDLPEIDIVGAETSSVLVKFRGST